MHCGERAACAATSRSIGFDTSSPAVLKRLQAATPGSKDGTCVPAAAEVAQEIR
jgi:hypothetical protein